MSVFNRIFKEAKEVFSTYFVSDDQLLSSDIKQILDNPEDRKKYFEAIDQLKDQEKPVKEVELELSNEKRITLSLNH